MTATLETIGVIGGGQMGSGIAQLAAVSGFDVLLLDSDPGALHRASEGIGAAIRKLVSKGKLSQVKWGVSILKKKKRPCIKLHALMQLSAMLKPVKIVSVTEPTDAIESNDLVSRTDESNCVDTQGNEHRDPSVSASISVSIMNSSAYSKASDTGP